MRSNAGVVYKPSMAGERASNIMIDAGDGLPGAGHPKAVSPPPVMTREERVVEKRIMEECALDDITLDETTFDKLVLDEPVIDKIATEETVLAELEFEEPALDKPLPDKRAVEERFPELRLVVAAAQLFTPQTRQTEPMPVSMVTLEAEDQLALSLEEPALSELAIAKPALVQLTPDKRLSEQRPRLRLVAPPGSWPELQSACGEERESEGQTEDQTLSVHSKEKPSASVFIPHEPHFAAPSNHPPELSAECAETQPPECPPPHTPKTQRIGSAGQPLDPVRPVPSVDRCGVGEGEELMRVMTQNVKEFGSVVKQTDAGTEAVEEVHQESHHQGRETRDESAERDKRSPYVTLFQTLQYDDSVDPRGEGLLYYQKFWYLSEVEISVGGELLRGTALEFHQNTLRLINETHSYYIPLRQVDYIRTGDGLKTCFSDGRFGTVPPLRGEAQKSKRFEEL